MERYASSAFNVCERQPLPLMDTAPPLRLFVDQQATPTAVMSPPTLPIHWQQPVKESLDRDASLYRVYVRVHNRRARAHRVPVSMTICT